MVRGALLRLKKAQPVRGQLAFLVQRLSATPGRRNDSPGRPHHVEKIGPAIWDCDCDSWKYRHRCRHVTAAKFLLEQDESHGG
jgi:hypothetical protein